MYTVNECTENVKTFTLKLSQNTDGYAVCLSHIRTPSQYTRCAYWAGLICELSVCAYWDAQCAHNGMPNMRTSAQ